MQQLYFILKDLWCLDVIGEDECHNYVSCLGLLYFVR